MAIRTTTIEKCPHCGNIVNYHYQVGTNRKIKIGPPFNICPSCKKPYKIPDSNEWLFLPQEKRDEYLIFGEKGYDKFGLIGMSIATAVLTLIAIICSASGNHFIWILAGGALAFLLLLWVIPDLVKRSKHNVKYNSIIESSIDRCTIPDYLKALKSVGSTFYGVSEEEYRENPRMQSAINSIYENWKAINNSND